jgi:hypothetical protein
LSDSDVGGCDQDGLLAMGGSLELGSNIVRRGRGRSATADEPAPFRVGRQRRGRGSLLESSSSLSLSDEAGRKVECGDKMEGRESVGEV